MTGIFFWGYLFGGFEGVNPPRDSSFELISRIFITELKENSHLRILRCGEKHRVLKVVFENFFIFNVDYEKINLVLWEVWKGTLVTT